MAIRSSSPVPGENALPSNNSLTTLPASPRANVGLQEKTSGVFRSDHGFSQPPSPTIPLSNRSVEVFSRKDFTMQTDEPADLSANEPTTQLLAFSPEEKALVASLAIQLKPGERPTRSALKKPAYVSLNKLSDLPVSEQTTPLSPGAPGTSSSDEQSPKVRGVSSEQIDSPKNKPDTSSSGTQTKQIQLNETRDIVRVFDINEPVSFEHVRAEPIRQNLLQRIGSAVKGFFANTLPASWQWVRSCFEKGGCTRLGGKEDEYLVTSLSLKVGSEKKKAEIFGICCGVGGGAAAKFAEKNFPDHLKRAFEHESEKALKNSETTLSLDQRENAFKTAFTTLNLAYERDAKEFDNLPKAVKENLYDLMENESRCDTRGAIGATMNMVILLDGMLFSCNLGDSRAILIDEKGIARSLSSDHSKTDAYVRTEQLLSDSLTIIKKRLLPAEGLMGGYSLRTQRELGYSHTPEIKSEPLPPAAKKSSRRRLIIASKGLLDVCKKEQDLANVVAAMDKDWIISDREIADRLARRACELGAKGTISVLVVPL